MSQVIDPEFIEEFQKESNDLLQELTGFLEAFEDDNLTKHLEKYGQIIDRMMGAAKSLGFERIGQFCELGKIIGYKAAQSSDQNLLDVTSAVLFDATGIIQQMVNDLSGEKTTSHINLESFKSRLKWLSEKFKDIERSSCEVDEQLEQGDIDDLLSDLGL